jgi:signal transduction histidine kinase
VIQLLKNGEKRLCSISATAQTDNQGNRYFQAITQDITYRKKAERDAMLAEKNAAAGRFVRTLAHEVRNPLTNIGLSVEQLEGECDEEDAKLFTGIIRRNVQRINDLITELLNSSRPSEVALTRVPVHQLMNDTLALAIDRIQLKNIEVIKEYGEDCLLAVDKDKFQIALLNLIVNAVEAMNPNEGVLQLGNHVVGQTCEIIVKDNGCGIPPEHVGRLFEPYFTSKNNGIGLGLASALNIIQSHKATVEVESEVGKGTTFIISFPVGVVEEAPALSAQQS